LAIKSFEIDWEGAKQTVEYEDDLTFGELEAILSTTLDVSDLQNPKVDIPKYRMSILTKVLRKAPFPVGDTNSIRTLKSSVAKIVIREVMKSFPLARFLEDWVETFTGSLEETISSTTSITSVPPSSAGTKEQ
tara:strand:- start:93 stop:491 length:399 start_codon:yes stop_codon:yes gene_type:complete